jgi:hypothetical protein
MAWIPLALTLITTSAALWLHNTRWATESLWASRLAYTALALQGPLYFLQRGSFRFRAPACEWTFGLDLAIYSLTNYQHIVLFGLFYLLTFAQLRGVKRRIMWSVAATLAMGLLVELAQGVSGHHHCRMRDLVPDLVGVIWGAAVAWTAPGLLRHLQRRQPSLRD